MVTPVKKKLRKSFNNDSIKVKKIGSEYEKQILYTEVIGGGGTLICFIEKGTLQARMLYESINQAQYVREF